MDYGGGSRTVQEQEIIEHYVTECRRTAPVVNQMDFIDGNGILHMSTAERSYEEQTFSPGFRSNESFMLSSNIGDDTDRRYLNTGERDCSRDVSLLQSTGGASALSQSATNGATTLVKNRSSSGNMFANNKVESYGYDVHEVHTSEGGARIVQTRGSGLIENGEGAAIEQRDRSLTEQHTADGCKIERNTTLIEERIVGDRRPPTSKSANTVKDVTFVDPVRSTTVVDYRNSDEIYRNNRTQKLPVTVINDLSYKNTVDSSLSRKNSYKRMQQNQLDDAVDIYTPRSDASLMRGSNKSDISDANRRASQRILSFLDKLRLRIRETDWTPRLIGLLILLFLLLILFFVLIGIIISAALGGFSTTKLILFPPICEECRRKSPPSYEQKPSTLYIHYYNSDQTHLEIKGNPPLKSNSFTAIDFTTGYIAIVDHALRDNHGKNFVCFIMPLDRTALPSMDALKDAVASSSTEVRTEFGWQEYWQFQPEQIDSISARNKFSTNIDQCDNARWYLLKHTVYTRDAKCSDCYDFCLPDYSVQRLQKYKDDMTLNIRRLNCFRLYVPEWTKFQIRSDNQGGHWLYPNNENVELNSGSIW